jgi:RNA polymerase-binding transcription factor DksA
MNESLEPYIENNEYHYCSECGQNIPSEFMPKHEEIMMCVYCYRNYRPRF